MLDLAPCCATLRALLYAYWLLAAGAALAALLPLPALGPFRAAVALSACRGKTWEARPRGALGRFSVGPLLPLLLLGAQLLFPRQTLTHSVRPQDASVPQAFFAHFYALGVACNTLALLALAASAGAPQQAWHAPTSGGGLALGALQLHLLRRLAESLLLTKHPPSARMHVLAYLFGLSYYALLPLSLVGLRDLERVAARALGHAPPQAAPLHSWAADSGLSALGAPVFLWGSWIQWRAHVILARLGAGGAPAGAAQYRIPRGGWFELVSCPHYLGEVLLYCGLALLAAPAGPLPLLILAWVGVNLALAARASQAWYHKKFPEYPPQRRALIPFLF